MGKEWLIEQIEKLSREKKEAECRCADAEIKFLKAKAEYKAAEELVETISGCIRGLKTELDFMRGREGNDEIN